MGPWRASQNDLSTRYAKKAEMSRESSRRYEMNTFIRDSGLLRSQAVGGAAWIRAISRPESARIFGKARTLLRSRS